MRIAFGNLIDTKGHPVGAAEWQFVPADVELEGNGWTVFSKFRDSPPGQTVSCPPNADAAFLRARVPRVFGYTPIYDEANEKCLMWEGFVAVDRSSEFGIPFLLTDNYGESGLLFGDPGPDDPRKSSIAESFWGLLAADRMGVEDFEQSIYHYGCGATLYFACKNGEILYWEEAE